VIAALFSGCPADGPHRCTSLLSLSYSIKTALRRALSSFVRDRFFPASRIILDDRILNCRRACASQATLMEVPLLTLVELVPEIGGCGLDVFRGCGRSVRVQCHFPNTLRGSGEGMFWRGVGCIGVSSSWPLSLMEDQVLSTPRRKSLSGRLLS